MRPVVSISPARLPRPADVVRRRAFPAWIDAEQGMAFSSIVTPRVRDGLVLRLVAKRKIVPVQKGPHARGAR
jgi:hypothetical protein